MNPAKKLNSNDLDVARITELGISFPNKYEPNTINHQQNLVERSMRDFKV